MLKDYAGEEQQTKTGKSRAAPPDAGTVKVQRKQSQQQLDDYAAWSDAWQTTVYVSARAPVRRSVDQACILSETRLLRSTSLDESQVA